MTDKRSRIIDLKTWSRREVFEFYMALSDPYCGVCLDADCTGLYREAKRRKVPVSAALMHRVLVATDAVENFRYRIIKKKVVCYGHLDISGVFLRPDETMGFSTIPHREKLEDFAAEAAKEKARIMKCGGLAMKKGAHPLAAVYYSNAPWFRFTQIKHPLDLPDEPGVPRVTTGKIYRQGRRLKLPLSIFFHHALLDGVHVAKFLEVFEK